MSSYQFVLDIGEKYIKLADAEKKGKTIAVKTFAYDENQISIFDSEGDKNYAQIVSMITKLIADSGIKKRSVSIVIPDSRSYSRIIEMPYLTEKELTSAIKYQADQFIPIPIDQVNLDIEILYSNKKTNKLGILIVASPTTVIDKVIYIAESAGLIPFAIENEAVSTLRFVSEVNLNQNHKKQPQNLMFLVNFGQTSTSLYLYDIVLGLPREIHNFSLGMDIFVKTIKANFNKPEPEVKKILETIGFTAESSAYNLNTVLTTPYNELVTAISKFIVSTKVKSNSIIDAVYLIGEGYKIFGLPEKLSTSLGIPCQLFETTNFYHRNNVIDFFKKDLPLFIPAVGANLR